MQDRRVHEAICDRLRCVVLAGLIVGFLAAVHGQGQSGGVVQLPSGSQLVGMVAVGTDDCCTCSSWPGRGFALLTRDEAWPAFTTAVGPSLPMPVSRRVGVVWVYTLLMDGRFRLDPGYVMPIYSEQETRAYPGGGQVILEPKWPIALGNPEILLASGCELFAIGEGWPLDRARSIGAGGESPIIGFATSLGQCGLSPLRILNEQEFIRDGRKVEHLLLSQVDPLYAVPRGRYSSPVLLVQEAEMSTVHGTLAYALRVYHLTPLGVVEVQLLAVGERGAVPAVLAVGDLNGDGYDDIVVGFGGPLVDRITVFLSNRDGTFRLAPGPVIFHTERDVRAILFGDFDGSGAVDLVVVGPDRSTFFRGDGTGSLSKGAMLDFGLGQERGMHSAAVADFDRDGRADIVLAQGGEVWVLLARGGGAFGSPIRLALGQLLRSPEFSASHIAVADFDDIPGPDLLVGSATTGEVAVLVNKRASAGSVSFEPVRDPSVGPGPSIALAADVTGDGSDDVLLVYPYAREVRIHEGSPTPGVGMGLPSIVRSIEPLIYPTAVAVADLDGDGHRDIAVACAATDTVTVLYGPHRRPVGFYGTLPARQCSVPVGRSPSHLEVLVEGGQSKLVVLHSGSHNIYVLGFDPAVAGMRVTNPGGSQLDASPARLAPLVRLFDPDRDGRADLLLAYPGTGKLSWVSAADLPSRVPLQHELVVPLPLLEAPLFVATGDFNKDGVPDVAVAQAGSLKVLLGKMETVCCTPGKVEYALARQINLGALSSAPVSMVVGDFNGDGREDIAVALSSDPYLRVWNGQGDGRFSEVPAEGMQWASLAGQTALPSPLSGLVALRLAGADHLSLVGYSEREDAIPNMIRFGHKIKEELQNGDDTLTRLLPQVSIPVSDAVIADLTGNGRNELALLLSPTEEVGLWRLALLEAPSEVGGTWRAREVVLPAQDLGSTVHMRADDLNGDRVGDVVLLDTAKNRLIILSGPGFTLKEEQPVLEAGTATLAVAASAQGSWIAAGRIVLYRTAGLGWRRSELDVGGGTPLAAWSSRVGSGGGSTELVLLVHRPLDSTYWLYCFWGSRLLSGDTLPSCEPIPVPARTEQEKEVLKALLAYSGTAHPSALLGAARGLSLDLKAPLSVLLVDMGLHGEKTAVALWPWLAGRGRVSIWNERGELFDGPTENTLSCSVTTQARLLAGDLTGNGLRDIALVDRGSGCVAILYNGAGPTRPEIVLGIQVAQSVIRGRDLR